MKLQEYVPLAPLTTLGVGGTARFFTEVHSIEEVQEVLTFAHSNAFPLFILGSG